MTDARFPDGFAWATASAAHQVEGDNRNNDWWEFEQHPGNIKNGDVSGIACDHYHRYREDFQLLRELNNNAHRLSVEWSRIEPAEGEFDSRQLRHYRDVLGEAREQGLQPMVTLHHFTSPLWFTRRGGWAATGSAEAWLRFARRASEELGDLVTWWCTLNEPNIYAYHGWLVGEFPPGRKGDLRGMYRVLANMRRAHEQAYRDLKRRWPDTPVGLAHNKYLMLAADPRRRRHRLAAGVAQGVMDRWPVGRGRFQKLYDASCDYIGINHYSGELVAFDPRRPGEQFMHHFNPPELPRSEFGYAVHPPWIREVLNEVRTHGRPVFVTENGIAAGDDAVRQQYLIDILEQVRLAIGDGVDVRGYFHWTNTDNFEWGKGYSLKFGLIEVDRKTLERTVKPSGRLYARIAQANALPALDSER